MVFFFGCFIVIIFEYIDMIFIVLFNVFFLDIELDFGFENFKILFLSFIIVVLKFNLVFVFGL